MSSVCPSPTADGTIKMPWRWAVPTDPNDPRWANDPAGPETARFRDAVERGVAAAEAKLTRNAQDIEAARNQLKQLTDGAWASSDAGHDEAIRGIRQRLLVLQEQQQLTEQSRQGL